MNAAESVDLARTASASFRVPEAYQAFRCGQRLVGIGIGYLIDGNDDVGWRLGLRMESLGRDRARSDGGQHGECNFVTDRVAPNSNLAPIDIFDFRAERSSRPKRRYLAATKLAAESGQPPRSKHRCAADWCSQ